MKKLISIALIGILSIALSGCVPRPRRVEVPGVVGMRHTDAVELIESKDLVAKAELGKAAATEELEFIVFEQDPDAGIKVLKGSIVDLVYYGNYTVPPANVSEFEWLDAIKAIGFNTIHTYSTAQCPWDGEHDECLDQIRLLLEALEERDMYGVLQVPLGPEGSRQHLRDAIAVMSGFDNAIASTVEEPDLRIPPSPTLEEQKEIYDIIKSIDPDMPVWGCYDGGDWSRTLNVEAYDLIMTDSYCYGTENGPVAGSPAAESWDVSLPWWNMSPWIAEVKIPMMHEVLPDDMPIINIQQGFYNVESHGLPNLEEEWNLYHEEFNLNSFAVYPHGAGQAMTSVCVMGDNRDEPYSIQNQCRALIERINE